MFPNPFDLAGPDFLAFFVAFSVMVGIGILWLRHRGEQTDESHDGSLTDPYEIAYLKGGRAHLLRVAVLSLMDRKLIEPFGTDLKIATPDAVGRTHHRLDQAVLQCFLTPGPSAQLFTDSNIEDQAEEVGNRLRAQGLLPDDVQIVRRRNILLGAIALTVGVGIIKLMVAFSRGKFNVLFLILLCVVVPIIFTLLSNPLRTPRGDSILSRTKSLLGGLHSRRASLDLHSMNADITLLAAAFGLGALPTEAAEMMGAVKLRPRQDSAWVGSSCGGSACGTSSCGGGGGCGGGGCGGAARGGVAGSDGGRHFSVSLALRPDFCLA
jgi:uncharacterized protein (TIGR04222 family)